MVYAINTVFPKAKDQTSLVHVAQFKDDNQRFTTRCHIGLNKELATIENITRCIFYKELKYLSKQLFELKKLEAIIFQY